MLSQSQSPCLVEHTSSISNVEVKQHWARAVLGLEIVGYLLVLLALVKASMLLIGLRTVLNLGHLTGGCASVCVG